MEIVTSWMEAGLEQGLRQRSHEDIIEVLEARFGEIPYALREQILTVVVEAVLKRLLRQAVLVPDLPAFQHSLAQSNAG